MNKEQKMVIEFHEAFGIHTEEMPTDPGWNVTVLRMKLIREEAYEAETEIYVKVSEIAKSEEALLELEDEVPSASHVESDDDLVEIELSAEEQQWNRKPWLLPALAVLLLGVGVVVASLLSQGPNESAAGSLSEEQTIEEEAAVDPEIAAANELALTLDSAIADASLTVVSAAIASVPQTIRFSVITVPDGAEVRMDGDFLCETPCDETILRTGHDAEVVIAKRRHHSVAQYVRLDGDVQLDQDLQPRRRSSRPSGNSRPRGERNSQESNGDGGDQTQGEEDSGSLAVPVNF